MSAFELLMQGKAFIRIETNRKRTRQKPKNQNLGGKNQK
jgi:hypothetical protein